MVVDALLTLQKGIWEGPGPPLVATADGKGDSMHSGSEKEGSSALLHGCGGQYAAKSGRVWEEQSRAGVETGRVAPSMCELRRTLSPPE